MRKIETILSQFLVYSAFLVQANTGHCHADEREQATFFENRIRPLLSRNCYSCHGPKKQESDVRVDSRSAMLESEILKAGHPKESLLVEVLERDEDQMPPDNRLNEQEIQDVRDWVKMGAYWPKDSPIRAGEFTLKEKNYWAFQPRRNVQPARQKGDQWSRGEIDFLVWKKFRSEDLFPEDIASKRTLLRRLYFDLIGLPPSLEEQRAFLEDQKPKAYERLVDRLLADPRYGEKWARHWLDLVRYAESDGYKQDDFRPNAWRYRDYVIQSLNEDKPYDQFVIEQLAGDEWKPDDPEALIGTGYLRHWIYEYNQRDVRTQWDTILNDITNVTGDVFLGMSMTCARCHDHKFDPILQKDYFRLKAVFAPILPRDDVPLAAEAAVKKFQAQQDRWLEATREIRKQLAAIEAPLHKNKMEPEVNKFPKDIRPMMRKKASGRSAHEHQLAEMAFRQVKKLTNKELAGKLKGDEKKRWEDLQNQLKKFDSIKPSALPTGLTVTDVRGTAPSTFLPGDKTMTPVAPGVLSVIDPNPLEINDPLKQTTGRRLTLAKWIVSPENPLTARVMVNRIWHYHFGQGIVPSTSDFGRLGRPPADLDLLDFLANRFVAEGWRLKKLHRQILLSSTYRQATSKKPNPDLRPFQTAVRRLQSEQIRDAMLVASGEMQQRESGPSDEAKGKTRSIYTKVIRNQREPLLDVFDSPDNFNSTSVRNITTTPTQSLLMMNGEWTLKRATAMAERIYSEITEMDAKLRGTDRNKKMIERLFSIAYCRLPTQAEASRLISYLDKSAVQNGHRDALIDLCHIVLNSNEFLYLD